MAKTNSYNSGFRILKTLEYLHNLPEPETGQTSVPVKPAKLAAYLTKECGETTLETAKEILKAIIDSDTGYSLSYSKSPGGHEQFGFKRTFNLEQVSLLSSIISSSMFLGEPEIDTLLKQLKSLTSDEKADELSQAEHFYRPRMMNKGALANLRIIHEAINNKYAIRFFNGQIDENKEIYYDKLIRGKSTQVERITLSENGIQRRILAKNFSEQGNPIVCFPYALAWDNSRCYLICGIQKEGEDKVNLWNYRVDRMFELKKWVKSGYRKPSNYYINGQFNVESYLHSIFKMFPAEKTPTKVTLRFKKALTRIIVEKFGFDTDIITEDNIYARASVDVQISRQYYGWLAGFCAYDLRMISPQIEIDNYINYLQKEIEQYGAT